MTNKRISKKIYFIIGVLLCAIIATVFGVLFANKDEKPSEIYVDVLPISASSDGSISSYSGVKNA
ncbi:MAG: hypothetical protein KBT30_01630, partial [Clostridiales bacterium]|nr:hypothetical protein [Candidatus Apopatousia equi]